VWRADRAVLDVRLLLGELLVDTTQKYLLLDGTSFTSRFPDGSPGLFLARGIWF
jgi:hypothetical protein